MARTSTLIVLAAVVAVGLAFAPAAIAQDGDTAPEDGADAAPDDPGDENATVPEDPGDGEEDGEDGTDDGDEADDGAPDQNATDPENAVPEDKIPEQAHECAFAADDEVACDVTGDGSFEDVNGDGEAALNDVVELFENLWVYDENPELFDFSGNGDVGHGDVVALFEDVST